MTGRIAMAAAFVAALLIGPSAAQVRQNTREAHCAAARAAAGTEHVSLLNRFVDICGTGATAVPQRGRGAGVQPPERQVPARETWYHPPAKVFDNLYFVGTKIHNAWAIQTLEGSDRHRRALRLCRQGLGCRRFAEARPQSRSDEIPHHQSRSWRPPWRREISAG